MIDCIIPVLTRSFLPVKDSQSVSLFFQLDADIVLAETMLEHAREMAHDHYRDAHSFFRRMQIILLPTVFLNTQ